MCKKILHVIGRLGKGGDSVAVFNSMNHMNLDEYKIDFITHTGCDENTVERLRKKGHKVTILNGDVRQLGPIKYYKSIKKAIKENDDYDAIHMHTSAQSGIGLLAAKHLGIKKRICHSHVNNIQRKVSIFQEKIYLPILKKIIKISSTHNVACGNDAGKYLFGNNGDFCLLNNGIDLDKFVYCNNNELKKELSIDEEEIVLGHVGRFIEMKNQQFIIDILKQLSIEGIKYKCLFLGDGENIEYIKQKADKYGVIDRCLFLGKKDKVYEYMNIMDILLLPSLKGEGFPTVLVEGQAAGLNCIVSDLVTKDIDMDLGLMKFCSLENLDTWINEIIRYKKDNKPSQKYIYKILKDRKFDSIDSTKLWEELYEI